MVLQKFQLDSGLSKDLLANHQYGHGAVGHYRRSDIQHGWEFGTFFAFPLQSFSRCYTDTNRIAEFI